MMGRLVIVALAVFSSQACFASKGDFEALKLDVGAAQRRALSADSLDRVQSAQLASMSRSLSSLTEELRALNSRLEASRGATQAEINGLKQDIARLQDLSGQSEARLREIRATLEEKAPTIVSDSVSGPGPAQLLQLGKDQMIRRNYSSGRDALNDLLTRFPTSDLAPDAVFEIAQSYRAQNNLTTADSAYADLVARYPSSPRVPSVLYKRGLILQSLGRQAEARRLFEELTRRFPRAPEAALARERLGPSR